MSGKPHRPSVCLWTVGTSRGTPSPSDSKATPLFIWTNCSWKQSSALPKNQVCPITFSSGRPCAWKHGVIYIKVLVGRGIHLEHFAAVIFKLLPPPPLPAVASDRWRPPPFSFSIRAPLALHIDSPPSPHRQHLDPRGGHSCAPRAPSTP